VIEIDLEKAIQQQGETFSFQYRGRPEYAGITLVDDIDLAAEYAVLDKKVSIKGSFAAKVKLACTRCLDDMEYGITADFDEVYVQTESGEETEDGSYAYQKKTLSLDKLVYDEILLGIPSKVLCKDDCKGLCQVCGTNLNENMCDCEKQDQNDNPFAQLKDLFKQ
jgi:uncharacterized protein